MDLPATSIQQFILLFIPLQLVVAGVTFVFSLNEFKRIRILAVVIDQRSIFLNPAIKFLDCIFSQCFPQRSCLNQVRYTMPKTSMEDNEMRQRL